jgi:hypothetical protein
MLLLLLLSTRALLVALIVGVQRLDVYTFLCMTEYSTRRRGLKQLWRVLKAQ